MDNWGWPHQTVSTERVVDALRTMLELGANVNMYMYHGGTNFGYNNGADPAAFHPQTTSYGIFYLFSSLFFSFSFIFCSFSTFYCLLCNVNRLRRAVE